jgi:hypothetical protein
MSKSTVLTRSFDYNSEAIVNDLVKAFKGKTIAGAISIGHEAANACMDTLGQCNGNKSISMATYPTPEKPPKHFVFVLTVYSVVSWIIFNWFKSKARNIPTKLNFPGTIVDNGVGRPIHKDFLSKALAEGRFIAAPDPAVFWKGFEDIRAGFDLRRRVFLQERWLSLVMRWREETK